MLWLKMDMFSEFLQRTSRRTHTASGAKYELDELRRVTLLFAPELHFNLEPKV